MISVSSQEHAVLSLARTLVSGGSYASVEDLLRAPRTTTVRQLSPEALRVLEDLLSKGVVQSLVRRGGRYKRRHLHDGRIVEGRLWQRHAPPALHFSSACVLTLQWLVNEPLLHLNLTELKSEPSLTLADEIFLYLCCDLVAGTPCGSVLGARPLVQGSVLCRLGFPELLGTPPPGFGASDFAPLLAHQAFVLEALQADLARRWILVEDSKRRIFEAETMTALGAAQEAVLGPFLEAIDAAGRRDLAGFLVEAGRGWVKHPASRWVENLSPTGSLRVRDEASRAAGAGFRMLARVARWDAEHRGVRFFDDDYDAAQLLLSEWSAFGEPGFRKAAELERALHSLGSAGTI